MKRIGIITHYDVHNHGALLQLTALIKVLKAKGFEASALRFDKNYDFLGHNLKSKYEISVKSVSIYAKYLSEKGLGRFLYNYRKLKTLNQFKSKMNFIGDYYSESKPLDAVIIGSDEVFALHTGPTPVFWGYCLPTANVFSYAASFGPTTVEDIQKKNSITFVKSGIESMKYVTVRDVNSAKIINSLTGTMPPIVVDPVILYGYEEETTNMQSQIKGRYLLVYAYDNRMNDPAEIKHIKHFAKKNGLKIVSAGFYHKWCDININTDPIALLSYFKFAECVITDTFHGCVMSLITKAKFAVKTRSSNYLKLSNLLNEYDLKERIFQDWSQLESTMNSAINYGLVNKELQARRRASMLQLENMLNYIDKE